MANWATLGVPPPRDKRDRAQTGRFVRAMLVRTVAIVVPLWVVVLLIAPATWLEALAAISIGSALVDVAWLSYRIRRDERPRG